MSDGKDSDPPPMRWQAPEAVVDLAIEPLIETKEFAPQGQVESERGFSKRVGRIRRVQDAIAAGQVELPAPNQYQPLMDAFGRLPKDQQIIVEMTTAGASDRSISEMIHQPVNTVSAYRRRAIRNLGLNSSYDLIVIGMTIQKARNSGITPTPLTPELLLQEKFGNSQRQRQVLDGILTGKTYAEIAAWLGNISRKTVIEHAKRLREKFEVHTNEDLVRVVTGTESKPLTPPAHWNLNELSEKQSLALGCVLARKSTKAAVKEFGGSETTFDKHVERGLKKLGFKLGFNSRKKFIRAVEEASNSPSSPEALAGDGATPDISHVARLGTLTPRESEVFDHQMAGESNQEIADALNLAPKTVKTHAENIYRKIGPEILARFLDARNRATLRSAIGADGALIQEATTTPALSADNGTANMLDSSWLALTRRTTPPVSQLERLAKKDARETGDPSIIR